MKIISNFMPSLSSNIFEPTIYWRISTKIIFYDNSVKLSYICKQNQNLHKKPKTFYFNFNTAEH